MINPIDLMQLLSFENPRQKRLDRLILAENEDLERDYRDEENGWRITRQSSQAFSDAWHFLAGEGFTEWGYFDPKAALEYMRQLMPRAPLIDLGCGAVLQGGLEMVTAAVALGLPGYIGIDKYNVGQGETEPRKNLLVGEDPHKVRQIWSAAYFKDLDVALVRADMLDFLARMKRGTYVVTINGIARDILINEEYSKALAEEVARVCEPKSVVFGVASVALDHLAAAGFHELHPRELRSRNYERRIFLKMPDK